jgi:hypothetical protein
MKTYLFKDQEWLAADLVHALHKGSRARAQDDGAWMVETVHRIKVQNGHDVRADSCEHFLDDLVAEGLLHGLAEG